MKKYKWVDADYWIVTDRRDRQIFRGTKMQCEKKVNKRIGQHIAQVILEKKEVKQ